MTLALLTVLMTSCALNQQAVTDYEGLLEIALERFEYPVIEYGDFYEPHLVKLLQQGDDAIELGNWAEAQAFFNEATAYIETRDAADSLLLLPVLDRIVLTAKARDHWRDADRAQHRYHEIIGANFPEDPVVLGKSNFRMGCWHFLTKDWYQAQFDFEEAEQHLDTAGKITGDEKQLLEHSHEFGAAAAFNCTPLAPAP